MTLNGVILGGLAAGLVAGVLVGHSVWQDRPVVVVPLRPNTNDTSSNVNLELHPSGSTLTVEWNAASPSVAKGFSGMLTVKDGSRQLQIPLGRHELETGRWIYYPESGWVEVSLELYQDRNHFTGQTVAMATGLSKAPPPETSENTTSPGANSVSPAGNALTAENPAELRATGPPVKQSAAQEMAPKPALRHYQAPAALRTVTTLAPLPSAPQIFLAPPLPAGLPAPVLPSAPPLLPSEATGSVGRSIRYEAAVPIRKVRPSVPEDLILFFPN
jgi:hypothetical protein